MEPNKNSEEFDLIKSSFGGKHRGKTKQTTATQVSQEPTLEHYQFEGIDFASHRKVTDGYNAVSIRSSLYEEYEKLAIKNGLSVSKTVQLVLEKYIEQKKARK